MVDALEAAHDQSTRYFPARTNINVCEVSRKSDGPGNRPVILCARWSGHPALPASPFRRRRLPVAGATGSPIAVPKSNWYDDFRTGTTSSGRPCPLAVRLDKAGHARDASGRGGEWCNRRMDLGPRFAWGRGV